MAEQVVELHHQGQEVIAGQRRTAAQLGERFLEAVGTRFDGLQAERGGFALHTVDLPEDAVELGAECGFLTRRLLEDRVHHLHGDFALFEEAGELARFHVQDVQQQVELRLRLLLRFEQLARQVHAARDVVDRHQQARHLAVGAHPVEVELQVHRVELAVAAVDVHFDLDQRVDGLDELFVDALAPQQAHVLHRRLQRLLRHDAAQQRVEAELVEVLAAEDAFQRLGALGTQFEFLVEQEQSLVHRAQDVVGFLLGARGVLFLAAQIAAEVENDCEQQDRGGDHRAEQVSAQRRRARLCFGFHGAGERTDELRHVLVPGEPETHSLIQFAIQAQTRSAQLCAAIGGLHVRAGCEADDRFQKLPVFAPHLAQLLKAALRDRAGERLVSHRRHRGAGACKAVELGERAIERADGTFEFGESTGRGSAARPGRS